MADAAGSESFNAAERDALAPYFTSLDHPVFALRNLPEVVKAALFARYSRSPKSLRRLFLDEFLDQVGPLPNPPPRPEMAAGEGAASDAGPGGRRPVGAAAGEVGVARSEKLFARVLAEYGDDSVAQLGGAHIAVEGASNLLTKALEWGRLMSYLEQSTRYIPYTHRDAGRWRYVVPAEIAASSLAERYAAALDHSFAVYERWLPVATRQFLAQLGAEPDAASGAQKAAARAQALDALRGLLPAATKSNLGIFGSGQAYELLLLRMRAHPLAEVRDCAAAIRAALEHVIPAFLSRVDRPERGGVWTEYFAATSAATQRAAAELLSDDAPEPRDEVTLTEFDPDGEIKVVAAALYAVSELPDDQLLARTRAMSGAQRAEVLRAYVGERQNRRHKPGRAFERTAYRFDVLADYGAFRDLQRHRLLSLEWQSLAPTHGYVTPAAVSAIGAEADWQAVMAAAAELYHALAIEGMRDACAYVLPMAYRVRFYLHLNAREAMHLIELRSTPQGHPAYRRVAQAMHRLIADHAGHRAIADAMRFVDHSGGEQGRLEAENRAQKRAADRQSGT